MNKIHSIEKLVYMIDSKNTTRVILIVSIFFECNWVKSIRMCFISYREIIVLNVYNPLNNIFRMAAQIDSINPKDQLANTGYSIEWVLNILRTNNPKFTSAIGNAKVKNVSCTVKFN